MTTPCPASLSESDYTLVRRGLGDLSPEELAAAVEILRSGKAVNPQSAADELPLASAVVLVKSDDTIVGVGAIKRSRPEYAGYIRTRSGAVFGDDLAELGYVAVAEGHTQRGLSKRIVNNLLNGNSAELFATTDDPYMARTLMHAGFAANGKPWDSQRGKQLSVWLRPPVLAATPGNKE